MEPTVLYEDDSLIAFDKPCGLVAHAIDARDTSQTLVSYVAATYEWATKLHTPHMVTGGEINLHGLLHRLDRDTSGIILFAKDEATFAHYRALFNKGEMKKEYMALVHGVITNNQVITMSLRREKGSFKRVPASHPRARGKEVTATTETHPLRHTPTVTEIKLIPTTGRTHQLRTHMAFSDHPIIGDILYGLLSDKEEPRLFLHASSISFLHNGTALTINSPLPEDFSNRFLQR